MRRALLVLVALLAPWTLTALPSAADCGLLKRKAGITYRSKHFHEREVAVYGDSITFEGWRLLATRADKELAVDARSGRRTTPTVDIVARDLRVRVPDVVVMAIGTNDLNYEPETVRDQVVRTRDMLPLTTRLLWVNVYVDSRQTWRDVNRQISSVPGVEVVDWASRNLEARGRGSRSPLLSDGVHLSCSGGRAWAAIIDGALRSAPFPVHPAALPHLP